MSPTEITGSIDLKTRVYLPDNRQISLDSLISKGIVISWIEPDKEPTKHIFNDLPLLKTELDTWGGQFLFLTTQEDTPHGFNLHSLIGLPERSILGIDRDSAILKNVSKRKFSADLRFPYIVFADKKGNIIYSSEGYRIGIGEQILRRVNLLK